jgi:hypothetical protein
MYLHIQTQTHTSYLDVNSKYKFIGFFVLGFVLITYNLYYLHIRSVGETRLFTWRILPGCYGVSYVASVKYSRGVHAKWKGIFRLTNRIRQKQIILFFKFASDPSVNGSSHLPHTLDCCINLYIFFFIFRRIIASNALDVFNGRHVGHAVMLYYHRTRTRHSYIKIPLLHRCNFEITKKIKADSYLVRILNRHLFSVSNFLII